MSGVKDHPRSYVEASRFLHDHGLNPREWTNLMFVAEALSRGYSLAVDKPRERIIVSVDGREYWWRSGLTSLNSRLIMRITKNKDVASRLLRAQGVPAVENASFGPGEAKRAWGWAGDLGPLVIKPSDGTWGTDVHVGITEWAEFEKIFDDVTSRHELVIVEPQVSGEEYRFLVVAGKVIGATQMKPAQVVGDGTSKICELIDAKNAARTVSPIHRDLGVGSVETKVLQQQGYKASSVPEAGQVVFLRRTTNLQTYGEAIDRTDEISPEHIQIMEKAARALPQGRLLGFDVLLAPTPQGGLHILEVNSGPMISIQHLPVDGAPRDVAGAVLNAMFPKHARPARSAQELVVPVEEIQGLFKPKFSRARRLARRIRHQIT